jgi:hypothetical protein
MKTFIKATMALVFVTGLYACKQNNVNPTPEAGAINVTNAVIGGTTLDLTTSIQKITSNTGATVSANNYAFLPLYPGQQQINLLYPGAAATTTSAAIPAVTYYTGTVNVNSGSNYSLFLSGASPTVVDNVLIQENYTRTYPDSTCGVRFINLAPGSNPVSVDIKGSANGSEVASLAYKAYSKFIKHPATHLNTSYIFEFRDASTGNLITSYTLATPFFHNVTLALRGTVGGAVGVIKDQDF